MTGINRIGQRVVCISFGWQTLCPNVKTAPGYGSEYTVDGFGNCPSLEGVAIPGIHLREIETPKCGCYGPLPWDITAFRPVVEDESKTDISAFKDLLVDASTTQDA